MLTLGVLLIPCSPWLQAPTLSTNAALTPRGPTQPHGSHKPGAPWRAELPRGAALVDNHGAGVRSISNTAGETGLGNYSYPDISWSF